MKKPDYQLELQKLAPSVCFDVSWSHDEDARWPKDCGERGDYMPYNTDVTAKAIVEGEEIEGGACMGGTWELPDAIDPEIGGFLPQMLEEAAADLMRFEMPMELERQVSAARLFLKAVLRKRWEDQQIERGVPDGA